MMMMTSLSSMTDVTQKNPAIFIATHLINHYYGYILVSRPLDLIEIREGNREIG